MCDEEYSYETRMKNETTKAFKYFNTYLHLGPNRSMSKVRHKHNDDISMAQLKKYSRKYHWVKRAEQKDKADIEYENEKLEEEQKQYFEKRIEQLNQYHQATDAVLGRLMVDLGLIPNPDTGELEPNNRVSSTSVANSIQNLSNANAITSKLALRFLGLPEQVQDKQEVHVDAEVTKNYGEEVAERYAEFTEAIMDNKFIEKQLGIISEMVEKEEKDEKTMKEEKTDEK